MGKGNGSTAGPRNPMGWPGRYRKSTPFILLPHEHDDGDARDDDADDDDVFKVTSKSFS